MTSGHGPGVKLLGSKGDRPGETSNPPPGRCRKIRRKQKTIAIIWSIMKKFCQKPSVNPPQFQRLPFLLLHDPGAQRSSWENSHRSIERYPYGSVIEGSNFFNKFPIGILPRNLKFLKYPPGKYDIFGNPLQFGNSKMEDRVSTYDPVGKRIWIDSTRLRMRILKCRKCTALHCPNS